MKRAKLNNDKITALYCRRSNDDGTNNESMSISTQQSICQGDFHPKGESPLPANRKLSNFLVRLEYLQIGGTALRLLTIDI